MITKTAQTLHEQGYLDSWKGKLRAAKETPGSYVGGHALASAIHGATVGAGGGILAAMLPGRGAAAPLKRRLLTAGRNALITAPTTAATAAAYGMGEAPIEYAYTKGFVPSKNPLKSMLGYVQVPDEVKQKYIAQK